MRTYMLKLLLLVLGCLLLPGRQLIQAAFLQECEGFIITQIPNPNQECSEYVYCDGDNSYYCNGECDEPVTCYNTTVSHTTQSTVLTEGSTIAASTEPEATTTTSEQRQPSTLSTTTVSTTRMTTSSSNPHVICRESGQNMVFPYPANKNYYYQCISRYLLLQQCPQNFYFNESQGKCTAPHPYRL